MGTECFRAADLRGLFLPVDCRMKLHLYPEIHVYILFSFVSPLVTNFSIMNTILYIRYIYVCVCSFFYFKRKTEFNAYSKGSFSLFITLLEHGTVPVILGGKSVL